MVKKLFALASVTALTGLMVSVAAAGCSSTTTVSDNGTDAATSPVEAGKKEASAPVGDQEEPAASTECKGKIAVDATKLPWKAPFAQKGACDQAELKKLVDFLAANDTAPYADWKKSVTNAGCNACIFGKEADATWKPLLENTKGELVGLNVGGCIAIASGKASCGQAYQNWFDCGFEACADCPADDSAALSTCRSSASKAGGGCKAAIDAIDTECGATVSDAENACSPTGTKYVFEGPIKAQCIGLAEGGE